MQLLQKEIETTDDVWHPFLWKRYVRIEGKKNDDKNRKIRAITAN